MIKESCVLEEGDLLTEYLQLGQFFHQHQACHGCREHPEGDTQPRSAGDPNNITTEREKQPSATHSGSTVASRSAATDLTSGSSLALLTLRSRGSLRSRVTLKATEELTGKSHVKVGQRSSDSTVEDIRV